MLIFSDTHFVKCLDENLGVVYNEEAVKTESKRKRTGDDYGNKRY